MLILFDIDGTLLTTERAGSRAMLTAGRELYGDQFTFDGVEISGRLDTAIWADAARTNGVRDAEGEHERFRATYGRHLAAMLERHPTAQALPGVQALIEALEAGAGIDIGLLTGNYPETGRMKIDCAELRSERFRVAAWGSDGTHRRDLPPVAMDRLRELSGRAVRPQQVVIIGDTAHDVDCARAHGCAALAVATGGVPRQALADCGADLAVDDLSDTDALLAWIRERAS